MLYSYRTRQRPSCQTWSKASLKSNNNNNNTYNNSTEIISDLKTTVVCTVQPRNNALHGLSGLKKNWRVRLTEHHFKHLTNLHKRMFFEIWSRPSLLCITDQTMTEEIAAFLAQAVWHSRYVTHANFEHDLSFVFQLRPRPLKLEFSKQSNKYKKLQKVFIKTIIIINITCFIK